MNPEKISYHGYLCLLFHRFHRLAAYCYLRVNKKGKYEKTYEISLFEFKSLHEDMDGVGISSASSLHFSYSDFNGGDKSSNAPIPVYLKYAPRAYLFVGELPNE